MAFLMLAILRVTHKEIQEIGSFWCGIIGRIIHYFFLATFVWMTIMSFNIFKQVRSSMFGGPSNTITKSVMVGYGVPLVIVLIMGIVELSTEDPCHPIKPKLGVD